MIEKSRADHHPTLFVDERIAPLADPLVDVIDPEFELCLAALGDGRGAGGCRVWY